MSNRIKVQAESFASDGVIDEVLASARAQDPNAGVANIIRDANGKVVEVELALPNSDSNGAAAAANAIASNPGVAKATGYPKAILSNLNSLTAYQGVYTQGVNPGDVGVGIVDSNTNIELQAYGTKGALNAIGPGSGVDLVVVRTAACLHGSNDGGGLEMSIPWSNSEGALTELEGFGFARYQPLNISQIFGFELEMTFSRQTGTISYSDDTSGVATDMLVEEYKCVLPEMQLGFGQPAELARFMNGDANWIVGGADSGVSKDAALTVKAVWLTNGDFMFYANGVALPLAQRNLFVPLGSLLMQHQQYVYSNGTLFHKPVKIDDMSFVITAGAV